MKAVIQRINYAKLSVNGELVSQCGAGFLVLVGFTHNDDKKIVDYVVDRVCKMRLFRDENGKTNKTLKDVNGEVMVVSNFTLYANTATNRRPDFSKAAKYYVAYPLYEYALSVFRAQLGNIATGVFGEHMHIEMSNDGPVMIIVEKNNDNKAD